MNILYLKNLTIEFKRTNRPYVICTLQTEIHLENNNIIFLESEGTGYSSDECIKFCIENFLNKRFTEANYRMYSSSIKEKSFKEKSYRIDKVINEIPILDDLFENNFSQFMIE